MAEERIFTSTVHGYLDVQKADGTTVTLPWPHTIALSSGERLRVHLNELQARRLLEDLTKALAVLAR